MKTERKGYQKAVLVIAVFTILAGALYGDIPAMLKKLEPYMRLIIFGKFHKTNPEAVY